MNPFLESNEVFDDTAELRRRAKRDGYLFFRHIVDEDAIFEVRRHFVEIIKKHGWLDTGTEPMDAISTQPARMEGMGEFWPVLDDFQSLESFHSLAHAPKILNVLEKVLGEPVLVHPRNIGRIIFPNNTLYTTPPHQDYVHIQGTPDVWTAWIPLGDCPKELGGLTVLSGSHKYGLLAVQRMLGAGGVGVDTDTEAIGEKWVYTEFLIGDLLLFHSHTVHRGVENSSKNRIRLSVDYRYQGVSQPITEGSLLPHFNRLKWDEIYKGWSSDRYQYYWKKLNLNLVPFDRGVYRFTDAKKEAKETKSIRY